MARNPDMGMRVVAAATLVTPEQVSALLALRLANMHKSQCPTGPYHWLPGTPQAELLAAGMIEAKRVRGFSRPGWRAGRLTEFGERVLLHVAEEAMMAQGRMVPI